MHNLLSLKKREKKKFPSPACLQCSAVNVECYLLGPAQAGLDPPAESISLFVMASPQSVSLQTKLLWANGLRGAGADIQVIMISFGVWKWTLVTFDT